MPGWKPKTRGEVSVPPSLVALLAEFRGCFSAWTYLVFCALACGLLSQRVRRTVSGMLVGAQLSRTWNHQQVHRFSSHSRWSLQAVSAILAKMVVRLLVAADAAVSVAIDDTLFSRRGMKVHGASWFHERSGKGKRKTGYDNNWVIAAIVVRMAFLDRPAALPVGFALVVKSSDDSSRLALARRLVERPWRPHCPTGVSRWSLTPPTRARCCVVWPIASPGPLASGPMPRSIVLPHPASVSAGGPDSKA